MASIEDASLVEGTPSVPLSVAELEEFVLTATPPLVDGVREDLVKALREPENRSVLQTFVTDTQSSALVVHKSVIEVDSADDTVKVVASYSLSLDVSFASMKTCAAVFVKRAAVLEQGRSAAAQLQAISLGDGSPFETMHSYIHNTFAPFFSSFVTKTGKAEGKDSKLGIPVVKRKMAELELALLHCQQNVDIPDVRLIADPLIVTEARRCHEKGERLRVENFGDQVMESDFLNSLHAGVNRWIREIRKVTRMQRDPGSGSAIQEINFWLQMEKALQNIREQLRSPEIEMTLAILRQARRFHATVSFEADTGLEEAEKIVQSYSMLMREFPLNDLLAAADVERMSVALVQIFSHMSRVFKTTSYPVLRAVKLVEAINRDMTTQLLKILGSKRLMQLSFDEFDQATRACPELFATWDARFPPFREELRKKRGLAKLPAKLNFEHQALQERLDELRTFRKQHEELQTVITKVLLPGTSEAAKAQTRVDASKEVKAAYEFLAGVDVLDVSKEGQDAWELGMRRYDERIDRIEGQITARLRDRLGMAKNANEMFRVFSKFNALFFRARIRGAIHEYQAQLIERVKEDIRGLQDKFKMQYTMSEASHMSELRDLPPTAGAIIWARQIERQLALYMQRVEDVLGKGWEQHVEGRKLKEDGDSFQKKLNTQRIFENWVKDKETRSFEVSGRIFDVQKGKGGMLELNVNFDHHMITLFKEVRNLQWLGFRVPYTIQLVSSEAKQVYPFAMSLVEMIRTYQQTVNKVGKQVEPLVASFRRDVQQSLTDGMALKWESDKLEGYVKHLADSIILFQDKVTDLLIKHDAMQNDVDLLTSCPLKFDVFQDIIARIQKAVDDLNLANYSNLSTWVVNLDARVEQILVTRVQEAINAWIVEFTRLYREHDKKTRRTETEEEEVVQPAVKVDITPTRHEIRIKNQILYLDPPLEHARCNCVKELHACLGIICNQGRIQSSRFDVFQQKRASEGSKDYRSVVSKLPKGELEKAYDAIEAQMREVQKYVQTWLQYQALWDMDRQHVYNQLGNDFDKWQRLLVEVKRARQTFDTTETERKFGAATIDYRLVQAKVGNKYDAWHKDILSTYGQRLGDNMKNFHQTITTSRAQLEHHADSFTTQEAVEFVSLLQDLKKKMKGWSADVDAFGAGQRQLERQRFQFPSDWIYFDMIDGEWSAFNDIYNRKSHLIAHEIPALQDQILAEEKSLEKKIQDFARDWAQNKPLEGKQHYLQAINSLNIFDGRLNRLNEELGRIATAKEALELEPPSRSKLDPLQEELKDLKEVWAAIGKLWETIDQLRETPWTAIVPRKVRNALEDLLGQLKNLPTRMKQYAAFEHAQDKMKGFLKANGIIVDLRSEALKERHWKQLMQKLNVSWVFSELTLGHMWDANLSKCEKVVKEILTQAEGEMALDHFLRTLRDFWNSYQLDLVNYQNKCKLIRGWDDLFSKTTEHTNSLNAMKASPYFKVFEEEAATWENKINTVRELFDVWVDVQRRWVYLEGVFFGSAEIKQQLPMEFSRFKSIDSEFTGLMKKVAKAPMVMEVLTIPGLQRSLERLADLLSKIQKALSEYLERERSAFPRFYFVGDEDLLDIIGNSKEPFKIVKHLKKMFAGIASLVMDDAATTVTGMLSREGEEVLFKETVSIKEDPKINVWLGKVEKQMRYTLAQLLEEALHALEKIASDRSFDRQGFEKWCDTYPAEHVVLATQILWSQGTEKALNGSTPTKSLNDMLARIDNTLEILADKALEQNLPPIARKKTENLIIEMVHQRDIVRRLIADKTSTARDFAWLYNMRFYWNTAEPDLLHRLRIHMANASFSYGYEYLGVRERLVQTPLTDRCYLTLTQALHTRMGGSPFGPAGTGKTETVKNLGNQMGRYTLVFNCDEHFDHHAMGRIFVGLVMCGAWGCFDEFNRLEERIMSAVSQQIQTIQIGLRENADEIELIGRTVKVDTSMGMFITMNPGYAGRRSLPDNLKALFRNIGMICPDRELIAQVMLFSQGFHTAEAQAKKVVPLFNLCQDQLSQQPHYDWGLRALKSVLVSAGNLKRKSITEGADQTAGGELNVEQGVLIRSICDTVVPKLVALDIPLLYSLMTDVYPNADIQPAHLEDLETHIRAICTERHLDFNSRWVDKIIQLYQILAIHHGVMMVGPSGSGKSRAWKVLLEAMSRMDGIKGEYHIIDPKAVTKEQLYGVLEPTTREWTDGVFTHLLRKIIDNVRGESLKRHWLVFDGDVDPDWVESMNSVLDDNKILTLPNGERLALPPNVRVMFEVQDLRYATLATVSRCGMVWFSEETVTFDMLCHHYLTRLRNEAVVEADVEALHMPIGGQGEEKPSVVLQRACADMLAPYFAPDNLVQKCLNYVSKQNHIMDFTTMRCMTTLTSLINKGISNVIEYNNSHPDFPMTPDNMERYITRRLIFSLLWGFSGSLKLTDRIKFGEKVEEFNVRISLPPSGGYPLIDYEVRIDTGDWVLWKQRVPQVEIETHKVVDTELVIPTIDTVRHEEVILSWLHERRPFLLCGPPGSGKTMTIQAVLRSLPDYEFVGLNFSSSTDPQLILKTFDHYCEVKKTPNGLLMRPSQINKSLVVFCDEINLPALDKYGTQRVISFMRQLTEQGGFWRAHDLAWVKLERIQFVGACNPPTDPGRIPLTHRFLHHAPVIHVDFPSHEALLSIYGSFNRALLRLQPLLRSHAQSITESMVDMYSRSQEHFTPDVQAHYIYSPRELTRWTRAIYEAIKPIDNMTLEQLVRLWTHEGLRLFRDRLVDGDERKWTDEAIDDVAFKFFPTVASASTKRPILFSNWLSKEYVHVDREELRDYVKARLKVFNEEELNVPLVIFNDVLDHVLRIDRVLRQPLGHVLLIGTSGGGKTVLSRFVAWLNGLTVFQIKVSKIYTAKDFEDDLRSVMRRAGCKAERMCFIFDESNVLESSFLEKMNALLASGEVPGLFEGDEYASLMHACKEAAIRDGLMLDSEDELFRRFTQEVQRNLHVVFTMNPANKDFHNRAATSPALFNRCVIDWFGEWSPEALYQVGHEFTRNVDLHEAAQVAAGGKLTEDFEESFRGGVVDSLVFIHESVRDASEKLSKRQGRHSYITPRHYLDFIKHFVDLHNEKRSMLEDQQLHINRGLQKLKETEDQVAQLQNELREKNIELERKSAEAERKLQQMMQEQQEQERKKLASVDLQGTLETQEREIQTRQQVVLDDLSQVQPLLREAEQSVKNIKKQHLDELRTMGSPPELIRQTMTAVCMMLGEKKADWDQIRRIVRRDDFIGNIIKFDTKNFDDRLRRQIYKDFTKDWNLDSINRASKACGPLAKWVQAQVHYGEILEKVEPLKQEISVLDEDATTTREKQNELTKVIEELERSISRLKEEYAVLISETQAIKGEMSRVKEKVDRSSALLSSLSVERDRWQKERLQFQTQMSTLIGDILLSSAFLTYIGFFDQHYREMLLSKWQDRLEAARVRFREDMSLIEFLSLPDERLQWEADNLPLDALCVENAIMLKRFNRYPLVIDPSGQAANFLMTHLKDRKIIKTSFLDDSFMKNLESSLRFGTPLLVEDVENIDPILNPVLNKELHKAGGRTLVRLADQDIDFSPSFVIFLATRDPNCHFTPDLCSRVTFVNFTVTPSSLQSQCLNEVLKGERPDIERKRTDLLKLQGEFKVRLRQLEESLLNAISEVHGNILDDNTIINKLAELKHEASEVEKKKKETDVVLDEIMSVSNQYDGFALFCSRVYFAMDQLSEVHFLYQFSLRFFLDIFNDMLYNNPRLDKVKEPQARLQVLVADLFHLIFRRVSYGLLHEDRITFALRLAFIRLQGGPNEIDEEEWEFLLKGGETVQLKGQKAAVAKKLPASLFTSEQIPQLVDLSQVKAFRGLIDHVNAHQGAWRAFMDAAHAETAIPVGWEAPPDASVAGSSEEVSRLFRFLLILRVLRADRLVVASRMFVEGVFGNGWLNVPALNLRNVVERESYCYSPLILCSMPGYDASQKVDHLATEMKKMYRAIALGSAEGYEEAEKAITSASKSGSWVLVKNVHLAPRWLVGLEKKLHRLVHHPTFRLFLTMELNPKVPSSLLRMSHLFTFEPPAGIKASLLRTFSALPPERVDREPAERSRLYFLLAWFHATVQERLRYTPMGWVKHYEFGETDQRCALDVIDAWVDMYAQGKSHLAPDKIPWEALRRLLGESVYGGRVDNDFDDRMLASFLKNLFVPQSFDSGFPLVVEGSSRQSILTIPEGTTRDHFVKWIEELPSIESPVWLGLAPNAEVVLRANMGRRVLANLLKIRTAFEEDLLEDLEGQEEIQYTDGEDKRPSWIRLLEHNIHLWGDMLPKDLVAAPRADEDVSNPLVRCIEREVGRGVALQQQIRRDLSDVLLVTRGESKATNYVRSLIKSLSKEVIPSEWRIYPIPDMSVHAWLADFAKRINQLQRLDETNGYGRTGLWLGGLFSPEAYITASRQAVAQKKNWALEQLEMVVHPGETRPQDAQTFILEGLSLEGAGWESTGLSFSADIVGKLPSVGVHWVHANDVDASTKKAVLLPVYLNFQRTELLFSMRLPGTKGVADHVWFQRGAAVTAWSGDTTTSADQ